MFGNLNGIIEMATLPSKIAQATAIGGVETEIVQSVAGQLKDSFKSQNQTANIKTVREKLQALKELVDLQLMSQEEFKREGNRLKQLIMS